MHLVCQSVDILDIYLQDLRRMVLLMFDSLGQAKNQIRGMRPCTRLHEGVSGCDIVPT